jgi:hypothetical protein
MADVEQKSTPLAEFERHKAPCQILRLVQRRGSGRASPKPFLLQAYIGDHALTISAETARDAFAKAIEWHVVGRLVDISISDSTRSYSIAEFALVMALAEMESTKETGRDAPI